MEVSAVLREILAVRLVMNECLVAELWTIRQGFELQGHVSR